MTLEQKIKEMNTEELALFLWSIADGCASGDCKGCPLNSGGYWICDKQEISELLREEVEE